jgi:CHAT domain-containing protein
LLVDDKKPHYWLQDVSLAVAPCLRILLDGSKRKAILSRALVIGDPLYSGTDYSLLPESKKEIAKVGERFPKGLTLLSQSQAVPDSYQKAHPELFSLIHFSAHVDADPQSPLESAIILSPGEDGSRKLYARDFKKLNADLVTVSGCSSVGKTALSGEGMVGFAWAAFDAGARNAVTSLWAVDDLSTSDLMGRFYAGVTDGKPYATALRDAKLQMLRTRQFSKPVYWAPFQLYSRNIGDGGRLTLH